VRDLPYKVLQRQERLDSFVNEVWARLLLACGMTLSGCAFFLKGLNPVAIAEIYRSTLWRSPRSIAQPCGDRRDLSPLTLGLSTIHSKKVRPLALLMVIAMCSTDQQNLIEM
jgi:hypothetical protein